ncbi:hypothetical protein [Endozoicomonas sp. YOMI1]|uniref:hypothetical protein n=1 Tax=Endozoicomonas sp. YOMI1 TaxID=2828739 RepID=UPI002149126E|nr:hypothetical protein [Endozoicomonas sp. YOMI1]
MPHIGGVNGPNNTQQTHESAQPAKATEAKTGWFRRAVNKIVPRKLLHSSDKTAHNSNDGADKSLHSYKSSKAPVPIRLLPGLQRYQAQRIQKVLDDARSELIIKGYTVKEAFSLVNEFAQTCHRDADVHLVTEAADLKEWKDSGLKTLFDQSKVKLLAKGYSPKEATEFAKRALGRGIEQSRKKAVTVTEIVDRLIEGMPVTAKFQLKQLHPENFQWAIGTFQDKGYPYHEALHRVTDALQRSGAELSGFQQWVKETPEAGQGKTQFIDDQLRPRMIEHIEQKGFSTEEATTAANQLIEQSHGDINRMATDAVQLPAKDASPDNVAGQAKLQGDQALALLGLSGDRANIGGIQPYNPPQPGQPLKPLKKSLFQRLINKVTALKNWFAPPDNPVRMAAKKALSAYDIGLPPRKLGVIAGLQIYQTRKIQGIIDRAVEELLIKGYSLDDARQLVCEFAKPCKIETDAGLITEAAEAYPWQDASREKVFQWSLKQLWDKGYSMPECEELAKEALGRGSSLDFARSMVEEVPYTTRQIYAKNYQWAMHVFTAKGYTPDQARQLITEEINRTNGTFSGFEEWVQQTPDAPGAKDS